LARIIRYAAVIVLGLLAASSAQVVAPVKVVRAMIQPVSKIVEGHGIIEPYVQGDALISSTMPLRVEAILIKPGDHVRSGDLLVKLQRDRSADMEVEKARISMEQAKTNLDRSTNLYEHGVIAKVSQEQAQTEYNLAKADYELKQNALEYTLTNSEIRSPIDGYVSSVSGLVGQIADPAQPILRVVNMSEVDAVIGIEIEDAGKIRIGQAAEISIPNLPEGNIFKGWVVRSNMAIDTATQLIHIWVQIDNRKKELKPGLFADGKIYTGTDPSALTVPASAVLKDSGGSYVFSVEDGFARQVHVQTGIETDSLVQVTAGLKAGQEIVYLGNYELEDSMRVEIQK
jgi:RND family efflux transporter MFP subunit